MESSVIDEYTRGYYHVSNYFEDPGLTNRLGRITGDKANPAEIKYNREWLASFTHGRPRHTEAWSVEQLESFGYIGLYRTKEQEDAWRAELTQAHKDLND